MRDTPDEMRCIHTKRGKRCNNYRIPGIRVCRMHGGAAAHMQEKAQQYLDRQVYSLLVRLRDIAFDPKTPPDVAVKAIREALSHTQEVLSPTQRVQVQGMNDLTPAVIALMQSPPPMSDATLESIRIVDAEIVEDENDRLSLESPARPASQLPQDPKRRHKAGTPGTPQS
jgi:hypothetical protein